MKGASLHQKKAEAVSKLLSSSSSIMGRRSLFAVVDNFNYMRPPYYSILQLDLEYPPEEMRQIKVDEKVRFNVTMQPHSISYIGWLFSPPKGSSEDLYMVPNWSFSHGDDVKPLHGYKFNFSAGTILPINLPEYYKDHAFVVSLRGKIYLISYDFSDDWYSKRPTDFQCYDPVKDSWKPLEPFPSQAAGAGQILATAVWNDTILLIGGHASIWAYDVKGKKWYPVEVEDRRCKLIVGGIVRGEAVVLGNTIYALTEWSVVVLSIRKESIGNHFVFKCSLLSDNRMDPILSGNDEAHRTSMHLVHLGKDKFYVVQSCHLFASDRQPIKVIYIQFKKDKSLRVIEEYFQWVKIQHCESFSDEFCVRLCFSLPKGAATALEQGIKSFNLDPCPEEDYASYPVYEEEIVTPVQEEEIMTLHKDGLHATSELQEALALDESELEDNDSSQINIIDEQAECNRTPSTDTSTPFLSERMGLLIAKKQRDWLDNQRMTLNRIMAGMVELAEKKGIVLETELEPETTPYLYLSEIEDKLAVIAEQDEAISQYHHLTAGSIQP